MGNINSEMQLKEFNFKKCPCCQSKDVIKFDVDFFCMDCDWNSILLDVSSGNFEKRIKLMAKSKKIEKNNATKSDIIFLDSNQDVVA